MTTRILIVDDNPINMRLAADVLGHAGMVVLRAPDADHALAMLQQDVPNLILMDIALPGMDGLTMTRLLKADARYSRIPVIALTASAMLGDEAKARAAGCDGYISKPINTRTFAAEVSRYLVDAPEA